MKAKKLFRFLFAKVKSFYLISSSLYKYGYHTCDKRGNSTSPTLYFYLRDHTCDKRGNSTSPTVVLYFYFYIILHRKNAFARRKLIVKRHTVLRISHCLRYGLANVSGTLLYEHRQ